MITNGKRPRLSVCIIVRDNESIIRACLLSILPWADEVIVLDTGSVDRTPEIAKSSGAKVFFFPWCDDFSAARNQSLRHATGDWIFWMDSDDTIDEENGRRLRQLVSRAYLESHVAYVAQVHCPAHSSQPDQSMTIVDHVKLFRNHVGIQFTGRIHEQVLPSIRSLGGTVGWTDIFVVHSGSDQSEEGRRRKCARDLRLLELELKETAAPSFTMFNFGMTYNDMGEHEKAMHYLQQSIGCSRPDESHLRKAYALLTSSLQALDRSREAEEACLAGLSLFPQDVELLFRRGVVALAMNRGHEAIASYRAALAAKEDRHFTSIDRGITGYKAHHNLAVAYEEVGDLMSAERHFRRALRQVNSFRPSWRGLMHVLFAQQRFATAEFELDRMQRLSGLESETLLQNAELLVRRGEQVDGLELAREACRNFSEDLDVLQASCRLFFENQAWKDAEQTLRQLLTLMPDDSAALHNLGAALMQQENMHEAIAYLKSSLQVRPNSCHTLELLAGAYEIDGRQDLAADIRERLHLSQQGRNGGADR